MLSLDVITGDQYTNASTLEQIDTTRAVLQILNAVVMYEVDLSPGGTGAWSAEKPLTPLVGSRGIECSGIRFRSAAAGVPARVLCDLLTRDEDPGPDNLTPAAFNLAANNTITPIGGSGVLTGIVAANGAIIAGAGFAVVRSGVGLYVVTFTTPFSAAPVVLLNQNDVGAGWAQPTGITANGFTARTTDPGSALFDRSFNFTAQAVA